MIKIGIIDDNVYLTEVLESYISTLNDIEVIGIAHNGLDGMKLIKSEQPNLVILDLIMPHSDGFSLLEQIYEGNIETKVLMLTAFGRDDIIKRANELGASYFLLKPFELSHLSDTIRTICSKKDLFQAPKVDKLTNVRKERSIEIRISEVLHKLGIPANLKGYMFLREAIKMVYSNLESLSGVTKIIYPSIAKKFHTTSSRVERAIRHSIEVGWNRGSIEQLDSVFGNMVNPLRGKPTNGEFIALIADHLRLQKAS
ncbi:sporulation transcription factor Spo0A [Bacillus sp. UNC438CL73TsuS30]|uniref:sporulation transcription factor Spo0A n=1 Tax=Bacillus sp. UNC438CL73TsuS30 TaxID=1340434 RepID=UPI00047C079F|nr:sporulation transcription factor Spo0A [Bacillus sp. UNC438CL73TsuS30]